MRERSTGRCLLLVLLTLLVALSQAGDAFGQPPTSPPNTAPPKAKAKAKVPRLDSGPIVMSAEAAARARGKTLEIDRYGGEPDWREVPPWRQASFFGLKAEGQVFIFVVDCSGSMADADRLDRAKAELMRSIRALQAPQRFKVIFYNDQPVPMSGELPKSADTASKNQLARWLDLVQPGGGTDPRAALSLAVGLKPDAVFLLSDGAFPEGAAGDIARANPKKVPIHCVDLANGAGGDDLRAISRDSGGRYVAR